MKREAEHLTMETGAGTTMRIDRYESDRIAVFEHCQTTLVDSFRGLLPRLEYRQNRAVVHDPTAPLPVDPPRVCIEMALTYELRKGRRRGAACTGTDPRRTPGTRRA